MTLQELGYLGAGALLSALLLAVVHWCPATRKLPRLASYELGAGCLWAGFSLWRGLAGDWVTPLGLAVIIAVGGITVIAGYRIDKWVRRLRQAEMAEEADEELP